MNLEAVMTLDNADFRLKLQDAGAQLAKFKTDIAGMSQGGVMQKALAGAGQAPKTASNVMATALGSSMSESLTKMDLLKEAAAGAGMSMQTMNNTIKGVGGDSSASIRKIATGAHGLKDVLMGVSTGGTLGLRSLSSGLVRLGGMFGAVTGAVGLYMVALLAAWRAGGVLGTKIGNWITPLNDDLAAASKKFREMRKAAEEADKVAFDRLGAAARKLNAELQAVVSNFQGVYALTAAQQGRQAAENAAQIEAMPEGLGKKRAEIDEKHRRAVQEISNIEKEAADALLVKETEIANARTELEKKLAVARGAEKKTQLKEELELLKPKLSAAREEYRLAMAAAAVKKETAKIDANAAITAAKGDAEMGKIAAQIDAAFGERDVERAEIESITATEQEAKRAKIDAMSDQSPALQAAKAAARAKLEKDIEIRNINISGASEEEKGIRRETAEQKYNNAMQATAARANPESKLEIASDRLARIGGYLGGSGVAVDLTKKLVSLQERSTKALETIANRESTETSAVWA